MTPRASMPARASAAVAKNRPPLCQLRVPSDTSTSAPSWSNQSHGKGVSSGRSAIEGPTKAKWSGKSSRPTNSGVENTSTRWGENRRSAVAAVASSTPAPRRTSRCRPSAHSFTLGIRSIGSVSSADVVADVAQGRSSASATAVPASACWSTTSASGANASTAARTPGTMHSARGTRNSPTRCLTAAAPRRSSARASMWSRTASDSGTGMNVTSSGRASATTSGGPAQATSWPRAISSRPTAIDGLTWPTMGGTTNR